MWTILGTIFLAPVAFVGGIILVIMVMMGLNFLFNDTKKK